MFRFCVTSIYLPLLQPSVPPQQGSAEPSTNTFLVAWSAHNLLIALSALPAHICFGLHRLSQFRQFTYVFEFEHACICFISMFHIFPSQSTPIGSAERPWTTTQKGQPYYLDVQRATLVPIRLAAHIHVYFTLPHKIHTTKFSLH